MTDNVKSIEEITDAVDRVEAELSFFDSNTRGTAAYRKTVDSLKAEIESLHTNTHGLDAKARTNRLTSATSGLSLAQSDLRAAESIVAANRSDTLKAGKTAVALLLEVRDRLQNQRVQNVEAWLASEFSWEQIPIVRPHDLAVNHESVRSIASLGVTYLRDQLKHDDDFVLGALRRLSEHWAELRPLVEAEPNLVLNIATAKPAPVAKPIAQPATLNAALVAA
jgi:hypothetical protein